MRPKRKIPEDYRPSDDEPFMNERQRAYFRRKLLAWRDEILRSTKETLQHLQDESAQHADIADRASTETERALVNVVLGDLFADADAQLLDALATATAWASQPPRTYSGAYAICCDSWRGAGAECVKAVGEPANRLMLSPPETDGTATARSRLKARLHLVKCHGAELDPNYYGQHGNAYPVALASATLRPKVTKTMVAAAACCYGAQLFSPRDPAVQPAGAWPMASAYLRGGAYGLMGSTEIAWETNSSVQTTLDPDCTLMK